MTMTRRQLKALRRGKQIRKRRNVRTNNMRENPMRTNNVSRTYHLFNI